jgi:tetratricopeptide (TPR) repeat protein
MLRMLGDSEAAAACLDRARESNPDPAPAEVAELALVEGLLTRMRGEMGPAIDAFERGLAAAPGHDATLEGELLLELGFTLTYIDRRREGLARVSRARLVFERTGDLPRLARTLRVLGGIQCDIADADGDREGLQQARETLEQAQLLARRVGNAEEQAASLINLAVTSGYLGEYEAALEADHAALEAFETAGLKGGVACAYCNIADHLTELARWEDALDVARQALTVADEMEMPYWTTGALHSIALSELAIGNPQPAADAAEDALERALAHGFKDRSEGAFGIAIRAHEALGNHERVEELRRQSAELGQA